MNDHRYAMLYAQIRHPGDALEWRGRTLVFAKTGQPVALPEHLRRNLGLRQRKGRPKRERIRS